MTTMPANYLFIVFLAVSTSVFAASESPDEAFLEFLADLENINGAWTHPIDFKTNNIDDEHMTKNKITASESNDE